MVEPFELPVDDAVDFAVSDCSDFSFLEGRSSWRALTVPFLDLWPLVVELMAARVAPSALLPLFLFPDDVELMAITEVSFEEAFRL